MCGHGPSGRNGGFCETLWSNLPELEERFGLERALAAARASSDSVEAIGAWCEAQGVDAWFRRRGSCSPRPPSRRTSVIDADPRRRARPPIRIVALDGAALRARCDSPRFRRGLLVPDDATVHPARLALGLRARVIERGARVFEHSRVTALRGTVAETAHGRVGRARPCWPSTPRRAASSRCGTGSRSPPRTSCSPSRSRRRSRRSAGPAGESITDARTFLHYFRTTNDDRIVFGWGGGRLAAGARLQGPRRGRPGRRRGDPPPPARDAARRRGRPDHPRVGRPDRRQPQPPAPGRHARRRAGPVRVRLHRQRRRPVPPRRADHGRARRGGDARRRSPEADTVPVPPEPLAWAGGMVVRAAFLRRERLESQGRRADPLTRAVCARPARARHPRLALIRSAAVMARLGLTLLLLLPPRGE